MPKKIKKIIIILVLSISIIFIAIYVCKNINIFDKNLEENINEKIVSVDVSKYDEDNKFVLNAAMESYCKINNLASSKESIVNLLALADLQYLERPEYINYDHDFLVDRINTISMLVNMDFAVSLGDLNYSVAEKEVSYDRLKYITEKFSNFNVPTLFVKGNHDCYYSKDANGDLTPEEYFNVTFKDYNDLYKFNVNDKNAPYYYIDIENKKTRICVLNSFSAGHYERVINDEQLKFIAYDMLNFSLKEKPEEWTIVFFIHTLVPTTVHPEEVEGADSLLNILQAYKEGKDYNSDIININFSNIKRGNIAAVFTGHHHFDYTINKNGILIIGIDSMKYSNTRGDTLNYSSYNDIESDISFEILSIDTKNRVIYSTKVGNGENRFWNY